MSPLFRQPPILSLHKSLPKTTVLLGSFKHLNNAHHVGCQMLCFSSLSSRSRTAGKECRRSMSPAAVRAPSEEEEDEEDEDQDEDEQKKSKGQKKRESLRSVTWAKSLVDLKPAQIWNVLRLTSVSQQEEVFEAAMIAKKMGPSILRAKRRQLRYLDHIYLNISMEHHLPLIQKRGYPSLALAQATLLIQIIRGFLLSHFLQLEKHRGF